MMQKQEQATLLSRVLSDMGDTARALESRRKRLYDEGRQVMAAGAAAGGATVLIIAGMGLVFTKISVLSLFLRVLFFAPLFCAFGAALPLAALTLLRRRRWTDTRMHLRQSFVRSAFADGGLNEEDGFLKEEFEASGYIGVKLYRFSSHSRLEFGDGRFRASAAICRAEVKQLASLRSRTGEDISACPVVFNGLLITINSSQPVQAPSFRWARKDAAAVRRLVERMTEPAPAPQDLAQLISQARKAFQILATNRVPEWELELTTSELGLETSLRPLLTSWTQQIEAAFPNCNPEIIRRNGKLFIFIRGVGDLFPVLPWNSFETPATYQAWVKAVLALQQMSRSADRLLPQLATELELAAG